MPEGITKIAVEGFKSIAKRQEVEIRPLTILAGANSSGKSSIMQPLLMLKQTLQATYDPGPLKLDGPNVKFTSVEEFLSRVNGLHRSLSIALFTGGLDLEVNFGKADSGFDIVEQLETYPGGKLRHLRPQNDAGRDRRCLRPGRTSPSVSGTLLFTLWIFSRDSVEPPTHRIHAPGDDSRPRPTRESRTGVSSYGNRPPLPRHVRKLHGERDSAMAKRQTLERRRAN